MSAMLSPAVYRRCSENSTENPWNGLACSPAMNPSTMNLARRSSRATWRITSGFRYFSAVPAKGDPPLALGHQPSALSRQLSAFSEEEKTLAAPQAPASQADG